MQPSARMSPAVAVALLVGVLRAAQLNAPRLLVSNGFDMGQISVVLPALGLLSLAISPFGVVAAGYVWGAGGNVRRRWRTFVGLTFAATVLGFVAAYLLSTVLMVFVPSPPGPGELAGQAVYHLATALGLVGVPLVALAGGAVAHFRSSTANGATA